MTQGMFGSDSVIGIVFQLIFFGLFFVMIFYGNKIQMWGWMRAIEGATGKLQLMAHEGREKLIKFIQKNEP